MNAWREMGKLSESEERRVTISPISRRLLLLLLLVVAEAMHPSF